MAFKTVRGVALGAALALSPEMAAQAQPYGYGSQGYASSVYDPGCNPRELQQLQRNDQLLNIEQQREQVLNPYTRLDPNIQQRRASNQTLERLIQLDCQQQQIQGGGYGGGYGYGGVPAVPVVPVVPFGGVVVAPGGYGYGYGNNGYNNNGYGNQAVQQQEQFQLQEQQQQNNFRLQEQQLQNQQRLQWQSGKASTSTAAQPYAATVQGGWTQRTQAAAPAQHSAAPVPHPSGGGHRGR